MQTSLAPLVLLALGLSPPGQEAHAAADGDEVRGDLADVLDASAPDAFVPVVIVLADPVPARELDGLRAAGLSKADRRAYVTARLKEHAAASQAALLRTLREHAARGAARKLRPLWIHNVVAAEVTPAVARELSARADVLYLHRDTPARPEAPVGEATLAPTCGLDLIGAPDVWASLGITGRDVVVGVIDTGVCPTHPDIAGRLWRNPCETDNGVDDDGNGYVDDLIGWNFRDDTNDTSDELGRGSHVAGTVAGDGTSGTDSGAAPGAEIMVLKIWANFAGESVVWEAMQYGADNGADVLNGSFGWPAGSADRATWRAVCENTIAAGVVVVTANGSFGCGNPPADVMTPGDVPAVIAVGAVDCGDVRAGFSSCGPTTWQDVPPYHDHPYPPGLIKPDVMGPGVNALSHDTCAGYTFFSGTSSATGYVSGVAALLLEADPFLDHAGVKAVLESTAVDLEAPGKENATGSGRVDAVAAVTAALANGNHCVAKQSSCGGTPVVSCTGTASATDPTGFTVTAGGVPGGRKVALLVYTDQGPANIPALGGAICIQSFSRSVPVFSTGTQGLCDGTVSIDMNAFRAGSLGGNPKPFLSVPGTTVHCQFWVRDGPNTFGALLTGAYAYTICP